MKIMFTGNVVLEKTFLLNTIEFVEMFKMLWLDGLVQLMIATFSRRQL